MDGLPAADRSELIKGGGYIREPQLLQRRTLFASGIDLLFRSLCTIVTMRRQSNYCYDRLPHLDTTIVQLHVYLRKKQLKSTHHFIGPHHS